MTRALIIIKKILLLFLLCMDPDVGKFTRKDFHGQNYHDYKLF